MRKTLTPSALWACTIQSRTRLSNKILKLIYHMKFHQSMTNYSIAKKLETNTSRIDRLFWTTKQHEEEKTT